MNLGNLGEVELPEGTTIRDNGVKNAGGHHFTLKLGNDQLTVKVKADGSVKLMSRLTTAKMQALKDAGFGDLLNDIEKEEFIRSLEIVGLYFFLRFLCFDFFCGNRSF